MIAFAAICVAAIVLSGSPMTFIVDGVFTRITRNTFTVLALIIPVLAGLGLNFGIVIGAVAAQIAVFCVVYWGFGVLAACTERVNCYPAGCAIWLSGG